ncbi:protein FANTASTIC FOUR 3-like [Primulina eburnea]|uniref:protein FANTASTIC FOUR 3-like n=1 Tax=Primulina eburnea TaxID=1245227 RepID=UPI003C6C9F49
MIIENQVVHTQDLLGTFVDYKFTLIPFNDMFIHSFFLSFSTPPPSPLLSSSVSQNLNSFSRKKIRNTQNKVHMSATVCQNIVFSCFELMAETAATTIKLSVSEAAPPTPASDFQFTSWGCRRIYCDDATNSKGSLGDYSFYPNPICEKSSIARLSAKSLEMCTENLGSETGTDTIPDVGSIFSSSSSSFDQENSLSSKGSDQEKLKNNVKLQPPRYEEASSCRKFPPPLTTMSGTGSIQVRRHCEGGRLIIEAVERPLRNSYLQVERGGGRLRLCYLTDSESDSDLDTTEPPQEEDEAGGVFESGTEEFGFQMLSRCKERRHENGGLCSNWKPAFWVATS